jgi:RNA polymerase sigma-70 factor, ECF subfamily
MMTAVTTAFGFGAVSAADDSSALVVAAQQGDRTAFGQLYQRYGRFVHGIVLARVPLADVPDIVQDVFIVAMQRLPGLRDTSAFGGWLAAIARNRATDHVRQRRTEVELPDGLSTPHVDRTEALEIMAMIRTLPDTYRETLTLRLVEGLTGPEIAASTGLTEGSVRVNLHRGMKQLRERIGRRSS